MPPINPEILERLRRKLGVDEMKSVYPRIARKARETHLPRHLAALALAAELGINTSKKSYASDEERAVLRAALGGLSTAAPRTPVVQPAQTASATSRNRSPRRPPARKSNSVMVVYGRNEKLRDAMFNFLRSLGLNPIEWAQAIRLTKKGAPFVGEVLNAAFRHAAAVVVLLTPDDEARLKKEFQAPGDPAFERALSGQARPNVLFEAGRAFGSHPDSTILVQIGDLRPFSDTAGIHVVRLNNRAEPRQDLANRLEAAGCSVDRTGSSWLTAGDFSL